MEIEICQVVRKNDKAEEVTLFIKGIGVFLCFMKIGGKVMVVSRWSHGTDRMYGGNSLWLPKDVTKKSNRYNRILSLLRGLFVVLKIFCYNFLYDKSKNCN